MLSEITLIVAKWKLMLPVVGLAATVVADVALPLNEYERIGVMGMGVIIIGYLARAVADERRESKAERELFHKERMEFRATLDANTNLTRDLVNQHDKAIKALIEKEINRE